MLPGDMGTQSNTVKTTRRKTSGGKSSPEAKKSKVEPEEEWFAPERTAEEDHSIAIHEAGHAVAGLAFGYQIKLLTLLACKVEGGWYLGRAEMGRGFPSPGKLDRCSRRVAEEYFIYKYAGIVAEKLLGLVPAEADFDDAYDENWGDIGYCGEWMKRFVTCSLEAYRHTIWERTETFLLERERLLKMIAKALGKQREMNEADIAAVVSKSEQARR